VFLHHLTIWKADKQGDSVHFGEVLPYFSAKLFLCVLIIFQG